MARSIPWWSSGPPTHCPPEASLITAPAKANIESPAAEHPCLRYNLSPMSPGRTVSCWSGRWESNPRHTAWEAVVLPLNYARLSVEHSRATALAARAGRSRTAYAPRGHGGSSSLHARGPAGEHGLHPRPVDVLAGDDDAHTPARRMAAFPHQRRQGRGAGAFGERMRIAEQDADRLGDLRVRDFDDALGSPSNDLERRRIGRAHRNPVREGERGIRRYDAARFEREPVGVGALGLTTRIVGVVSPSASRTPMRPQIPEPSPIGT